MINEHKMTVTMPLEAYEAMKEEIKRLKKKEIRNYFDYVFPKGLENNDPYIILDQEKLIKDIAAANEEVTTINVKTAEGLLLKPIKVNGDTNE